MSGGLILATNAADNEAISDQASTAYGYMVLLHGDAAVKAVSFGYFTGGVRTVGTSSPTESTFTPLLKVDNVAIVGAMSIIVTYNPVTNTWSLKVRKDLGSSLLDPKATTATAYTNSVPASIVDATHTGITNTNMMMYFNQNGGNGMFLDNLKVTKGASLSVAKNNIEGLKVYPNPVKEGKLFISSASSAVKTVAIYNVLGAQVLKKEVTSGLVDVSSLNK